MIERADFLQLLSFKEGGALKQPLAGQPGTTFARIQVQHWRHRQSRVIFSKRGLRVVSPYDAGQELPRTEHLSASTHIRTNALASKHAGMQSQARAYIYERDLATARPRHTRAVRQCLCEVSACFRGMQLSANTSQQGKIFKI